jgi:hypothetical protein
MSRYKVMIDDNFHYMEEDGRAEHGRFATAAEALDACRQLVDQSLVAEYKAGATAQQLYERYASFGDDPFVVALGEAPKVEFSAHAYARERTRGLTAPEPEGSKRRQAVLDRKSTATGSRP